MPAQNAAPLGEFPNSRQKVRAFWLLAIGAYENADKPAAYHYLGHVVHHFGDLRRRQHPGRLSGNPPAGARVRTS